MKTCWILTYEIPYEGGGAWCVFENKPTIEELEAVFQGKTIPPNLQELLDIHTSYSEDDYYFNLNEREFGKTF